MARESKKNRVAYVPPGTLMTNDELERLTERIFLRVIELRAWDRLNSTETSILAAKLGARFAAWAGDLIDF